MTEDFFDEIGAGFEEAAVEYLRSESVKNPLLKKGRRVVYLHGDSMEFSDVDGKPHSSEFSALNTMFEIGFDVAISGDWSSFRHSLHLAVRTLEEEVMKCILRVMGDAAESSGNVFDLRDGDLSDQIVRAYERIELSFDGTGRLNHPILVADPETAERIKDCMRQPEVAARIRRIVLDKLIRKVEIHV